jgi:hypothetical protein
MALMSRLRTLAIAVSFNAVRLRKLTSPVSVLVNGKRIAAVEAVDSPQTPAEAPQCFVT